MRTEAAIVTGASSGIGYAISRKLCEMGYEVYGLGRDFSKVDTTEEKFSWMCGKRMNYVPV